MPVRLKRIYEPKADEDGFRILVDRLWPRGLGKNEAAIDLWLKGIAPSPDLRRWFGHRPERWPEFRRRYQEELRQNGAGIETLTREAHAHKTVTLLYGAKDLEHNHALVLRDFID